MHRPKRLEDGIAMRKTSAKLLELLLNAGGEIAIPDNTNQQTNPLIVGAWTRGEQDIRVPLSLSLLEI